MNRKTCILNNNNTNVLMANVVATVSRDDIDFFEIYPPIFSHTHQFHHKESPTNFVHQTPCQHPPSKWVFPPQEGKKNPTAVTHLNQPWVLQILPPHVAHSIEFAQPIRSSPHPHTKRFCTYTSFYASSAARTEYIVCKWFTDGGNGSKRAVLGGRRGKVLGGEGVDFGC